MFLQQLQKNYPLDFGNDLLADHSRRKQYAGVTLLLTETPQGGYQLLFIRRAKHLKSHPNQVAFPGGKFESEDNNLAETALRETEEEVGVDRTQIDLLGSMDLYTAKNGILVKPFIGTTTFTDFRPSDHEIESVFQVPLEFFLASEPSRIDQLNRFGRVWEVPAWHFEGYEIWGMTAKIVGDLVSRIRQIPIELRGI